MENEEKLLHRKGKNESLRDYDVANSRQRVNATRGKRNQRRTNRTDLQIIKSFESWNYYNAIVVIICFIYEMRLTRRLALSLALVQWKSSGREPAEKCASHTSHGQPFHGRHSKWCLASVVGWLVGVDSSALTLNDGNRNVYNFSRVTAPTLHVN